jgi:hypothetical protein
LLNPEDLVLAEAERDVRELEQYLADQRIRVFDLNASGRDDEEMKAREGLLLLADALVIARRRLLAERERRQWAVQTQALSRVEVRREPAPGRFDLPLPRPATGATGRSG